MEVQLSDLGIISYPSFESGSRLDKILSCSGNKDRPLGVSRKWGCGPLPAML
jgi:hypothetical protein